MLALDFGGGVMNVVAEGGARRMVGVEMEMVGVNNSSLKSSTEGTASF